VFAQLNPPLPVLVTDKCRGIAFAAIDYRVEHDLIWVTTHDESGEMWRAPNPKVRMQSNWTMRRVTDSSVHDIRGKVTEQ